VRAGRSSDLRESHQALQRLCLDAARPIKHPARSSRKEGGRTGVEVVKKTLSMALTATNDCDSLALKKQCLIFIRNCGISL
jgi:hypothetical protein